MVIYRVTFCQARQLFRNVTNIRTNINNVVKKQFSSSSSLAARLYSDKHEWVELNGDSGTVGISDYAQEALGDVVFAQLPEENQVVQQGDECGALESVKAASELYSPVSGTITERNQAVEKKPSLINTSPYKEGWLFKIKLSEPKELEELMDEKKYAEFLKTES